MLYPNRYHVFAILLLLCSSCFHRNEVKLVSKNFEFEIDQQQNLVFAFDKDLAPDSVIDKWDSVPYIAFTPAVQGKFKWTSRKEILFSPLAGFHPSTDYTAELKNSIFRYNSSLVFSGKKTIPF